MSIDSSRDIIKGIRDHIKFLVTVEIFFSTIVAYFYKFLGNEEKLPNIFLGLGILAAISIGNYLLVGAIDEAKIKLLGWIRRLVLLNIFLSIFPIIILGLIVDNPLSWYNKQIFIVSFNGILWTPIATFLFIFGSIVWQEIKKIKSGY